MKFYSYEELSTADLIVDAVYEGGPDNTFGSDPFPRLLSLSNQGGFRPRGSRESGLDFLMLYTTNADLDWPDSIDPETGVFTYFGDNKKPGRRLHETGRGGNMMLRDIFQNAYGDREGRSSVPPVFLFGRHGESGRNVKFLGLAVPGVSDAMDSDALVAIWRSSGGNRFQNYRAKFSILNAPEVSRKWIDGLIAGDADPELAPRAWNDWLLTGRRRRLVSERSVEWRTPDEQKPQSDADAQLIHAVTSWFSSSHYDFEPCAARIAEMAMPNIISVDVTRRHRDGGRDAIGKYRIGLGPSSVLVDFALEAKCWSGSGVGVKPLSRLISRLRHRQFGILVTTSWLNKQAYEELKSDGHPIVVISSKDIVEVFRKEGLNSASAVKTWLADHFPVS